jgi:cytochrome c oxidase subunit 1
MLFAVAFLPMFGIGGLTGLPLGLTVPDVYLHDSYYVIGHFHYVVAPGTIFAMFAGIYYWYPKVTGRSMNESLGKLHFWLSLIFINGVFMPMMFEGMAGVSRRLFDPTVYETGAGAHGLTMITSWSAWMLALAQIPFIINFFMSMRKKVRAPENPWQATTLEWATETPPPHGNFAEPPVVFAGPYEYSVPGAAADFSPQWKREG